MQIRLPWILSRKRLVAAAGLDGVLFAGLYYVLFQWRFDRWPGFSMRLAVLLAIWMLCSYVVGRYVNGDVKRQFDPRLSLVKQITSTALVLIVTLGITILHLWLFNRSPVEATFRSFLLPFLGSLAVVSSLLQISLSGFFSATDPYENYYWTFVGSAAGFEQLQQSLKWSRLPVGLLHATPGQLIESSPQLIVVDDFGAQGADVLEHLLRLQQQGSTVLPRLSWCESVLQRFPPTFLADVDLLRGDFSVRSGTLQSRLKRSGDVAVAGFLLLITSPLLLISALLIKLGDRGPVFYSQIRTGLGGQPYRIWKLRSMRIDAEKKGAQWSSLSDSRITKIGAILRRTRLDELPQLWCVINGTMSLIGARPERPEFDRQLEQQIPHYSLRHSMRPGLSGWAQVNYPYGASIEDAANKLSYDLYYLRNFSFWLDLLILFKTIRLVFNAQGALPVPPEQQQASI